MSFLCRNTHITETPLASAKLSKILGMEDVVCTIIQNSKIKP